MRMRRFGFVLVIVGVLSGALAGCSSGPAAPEHALRMAPFEDLPVEAQQAPQVVSEAYQFAAANPDVLQHIPCYCGCGDIGHTSNYACYVAGVADDGKINYDGHALGCSICVDITQDAMRLLKQGQSVDEIRAYVDAAYARYGPSNIP